MDEKIIARAGEILRSRAAKHVAGDTQGLYCVLALLDEDGYPSASALTIADCEGIRWLTFDTGLGSSKALRIAKCDRASVCVCADEYNITLVGRIRVETDPAVKAAMWYDGMGQHFSGPDDPQYCVLRFETERYNLLVDWQEARGRL